MPEMLTPTPWGLHLNFHRHGEFESCTGSQQEKAEGLQNYKN